MDMLRSEIERILSRPSGTRILTEKPGMQSIPFSLDSFKSLSPLKDIPLCAIDGGQAILVQTPELLVGIVRVAAVKQIEDASELLFREENYCIVATSFEEGKLVYDVSLFGENRKTIRIDPHDAALREGLARAQLPSALEIVRRSLELKLASKIAIENPNAIIALDGELDTRTKEEQATLFALEQSATNRLVGVVKSSSIVTDKGASLSGVLLTLSPPGAWWYWPLIRWENADWIMAKLHPQANSPFRLDIPKGCDSKEKIVQVLANASGEISFPGYPYALLVADQFARISSSEASQRRAELLVDLSREITEDAHAVLNRVVSRLSNTF